MTYLRLNGVVRTETDPIRIANLVRKGWEVFTPDVVVPDPGSQEVPLWALRASVRINESLAVVDTFIATLAPARRAVLAERWASSDAVSRNSPFFAVIATGVGWGAPKRTKLFTDAVEIAEGRLGA